MDSPRMTLDQYNQLLPNMLTAGGSTPPDAIAHWVAETDDGLHVIDVWDSREAFDRITQEHLSWATIGPRELGGEALEDLSSSDHGQNAADHERAAER
jgi:hypothetical protein